MDAVDSVSVHVVDEATRAADPRDEHRALRRHAELRHESLHSCQDCVVAAAWAPACLLVTGKVLLGQGGKRAAAVAARAVWLGRHQTLSRISRSRSDVKKG